VPPGQVKRFFLSPGPLFDPEGRRDDYWRWAPALYAAGFRSGDIVQNTAAYHRTPLGFMFDEALRAIGCAVVPTGPGDTETQLQIIRELGVTGYVGVPSYLMTLIERAEEKGWTWTEATRLHKAFLAAEPFPPSLQEAFRRRGIRFGEGYGTAETGNLGYACGHSPGWHLPYDAVVQVVDLNSGAPLSHGEEGEIVATLFDETYALIRFGTGDLSALDTTSCPCGRTTPRLVGWLGRVGQAAKVRGMFVHPRQLAQVLDKVEGVTRYRALVTREGHHDRLEVQVEGAEDGIDVAALAAALQQVIKVRAEVTIVPAGTIPADAPVLEDDRTWE
jgi:phenylacetate-CoA ligase